MSWNLVLKFFLLKKVFTGPINNARNPLFFNKTHEHMKTCVPNAHQV